MIFKIKLLKCVFNVVLSEKSILLQTGLQLSSVRAGNWLSSHWHLTGCLFSPITITNCPPISLLREITKVSCDELQFLEPLSDNFFIYIFDIGNSFPQKGKKKNEDNQCKMLSRVGQWEDKGVCMVFSTWLWKPSPNKDGMSAQMLFFLISKKLCSFKIKCNLAVAKVTRIPPHLRNSWTN